jgi:hypothetical protein
MLLADPTVVVRARMRTEIEAEKRRVTDAEKVNQAAQASLREVTLDGAPMMPDVMYCCPEIGEEGEVPRPKEEVEGHIHAFLYNR